jgi:hypothetical protein
MPVSGASVTISIPAMMISWEARMLLLNAAILVAPATITLRNAASRCLDGSWTPGAPQPPPRRWVRLLMSADAVDRVAGPESFERHGLSVSLDCQPASVQGRDHRSGLHSYLERRC